MLGEFLFILLAAGGMVASTVVYDTPRLYFILRSACIIHLIMEFSPRSAPRWWICGNDQLPVQIRSGSAVVIRTVRKAVPYLGFAEAAICSVMSVNAPVRSIADGGCGQWCSQWAWESSCLQRRQS